MMKNVARFFTLLSLILLTGCTGSTGPLPPDTETVNSGSTSKNRSEPETDNRPVSSQPALADETVSDGKVSDGKVVELLNVEPGDPPIEQAVPATAEKWKPMVDDAVIARWSAAKYYQAKVDAVGRETVYFIWEDGGTQGNAEFHFVFPVPSEDWVPQAEIGDVVVVKPYNTTIWLGGEVAAIGEKTWTIRIAESSSAIEIAPSLIQAVTPEAADEIRQKLEEGKFTETAHSKSPRLPEGFVAETGLPVVAEWTAHSWYEGTVQNVSDGKITVAWGDGSSPSEIPVEKLVPLPNTGTISEVTAGQFVLVKPKSGIRWLYAQVIKTEKETIEVRQADGTQVSVGRKDCIGLW